jgi:ankyrin repeat protein
MKEEKKGIGNWKILLASATGGDIKELKRLLEKGGDPNDVGQFFKDQAPMRPLCLAYNSPEKIKLLLKHGADPNLPEPLSGETAIHVVADNLTIESAKVLLNAGADPNRQDKEGFTPLHRIAFSGSQAFREKSAVMMAKVLLEHGADPNRRVDPNRKTKGYHATATISPLAYASKHAEGEELCRLLLDAGADPTQKDSEGQSIIDYSHGKCKNLIIEMKSKWVKRKIKEKIKEGLEEENCRI